MYLRRRKLYNNTFANKNAFREIELFLSLNRIFLFYDEVNILLKYFPL